MKQIGKQDLDVSRKLSKVPALNLNNNPILSTVEDSGMKSQLMDDTGDAQRFERAQQLLDQFGDDVGSDDDESNSSSSKMSDVSNEFVNQLGQPKVP